MTRSPWFVYFAASARRDEVETATSSTLGDPTYKLGGGRGDIFRAGCKQQYSLDPALNHVVAALKDDLAPYEVRKGTIRFSLSQPSR
jgi:uncharacterized protein YdhG (YjbR/CyaY superfamily)